MNYKEEFVDNKYTKWYLAIVERAKFRVLKDVYFESHHILPKVLYPKYKNLKYNSGNSVNLTAKEHYICHMLLMKMFSTREEIEHMEAAFSGMSIDRGGRKLKARQIEKARTFNAKILSRQRKGLTYEERYGTEKAAEIKLKMSLTRKGVKKEMTDAMLNARRNNLKKAVKANTGRTHSDETKLKMSLASKGKPKSEAHKLAMRKPKKKNQ